MSATPKAGDVVQINHSGHHPRVRRPSWGRVLWTEDEYVMVDIYRGRAGLKPGQRRPFLITRLSVAEAADVRYPFAGTVWSTDNTPE